MFIHAVSHLFCEVLHLFAKYCIYSLYLLYLFTVIIAYIITFICDVLHLFMIYHNCSQAFTIVHDLLYFCNLFFLISYPDFHIYPHSAERYILQIDPLLAKIHYLFY